MIGFLGNTLVLIQKVEITLCFFPILQVCEIMLKCIVFIQKICLVERVDYVLRTESKPVS